MRYDVPIYDPYKDPGENYFHPSNEAAQYLVYIRQIYSDIVRLGEILSGISDMYGKKLIAKYIVVEWLSMDKYIQKLSNLILSGRVEYPVDDTSRQELQSLYKRYKSARRQKLPSFQKIRNKIAAHREPLPLVITAEIWDSLDIPSIEQLLSPVPPLFNFMKGLNIYRWTKTEKNENGHKIMAFVQPLIIDREKNAWTPWSRDS